MLVWSSGWAALKQAKQCHRLDTEYIRHFFFFFFFLLTIWAVTAALKPRHRAWNGLEQMLYSSLYTLSVSPDRGYVTSGSVRQSQGDVLVGTLELHAVPSPSSRDWQNTSWSPRSEQISVAMFTFRSCTLVVRRWCLKTLFLSLSDSSKNNQNLKKIRAEALWRGGLSGGMFEVGKALGVEGEPSFS